MLLAAVPFLGAVPLEALARNWTLLFAVFLPGVVLPLLHTNLWEELGWAGFLQSTLQERRGPLLASVIVAPFFALFHLPALFVSGWIMDEGYSPSQFPSALVQVGVLMVFAVFVRVLIMWLYNGTGRSILMVGLSHAALNVITGQKVMPELVPGIDSNLLAAAVVAVLGVLVVVFTKGRLGYDAERTAPRPPEAGRVAARPSAQ
jgi:membrane protease YdiL (CAAX protease family)